ncbi:WD40 repeat-like protein [Auriscalpium vulgare]|uniref:WD40 repeat-like protein n=1 Tax=Auriscalpium vulgare TaxID=40419 RepID=A0ACB8S575_9AGAM|nr:WD40 repeat-like protein [Auriscalpium vulgare]
MILPLNIAALPLPKTLATTTIQHDFPNVLSDVYSGNVPAENIWLSFCKKGEHSVHSKLAASLHDTDRERVVLSGSSTVSLDRQNQYKYRARWGFTSSTVISPSLIVADPAHSNEQQPHQITAFAISSSPDLIATGLADGTLSLYRRPPVPQPRTPYPSLPVHSTTPLATGTAHKSTISALQFMRCSQGGMIVASAGADFAVHLTPVHEDVSTAPLAPTSSFTAHTRPVTALAPLAFHPSALLSGARDGALRLWDTYSGAQAGAWEAGADVGALIEDGRVTWAALADGHAEAFDIRARGAVARFRAGDAALSAIDVCVTGRNVVAGGEDGVVAVFDVRTMGQGSSEGGAPTLARWQRTGGVVEGVAFASGSKIVIGGADGLPYVIRFGEEFGVDADLVFGDVEAVRGMHVDGKDVWLAGDGGVLRKYEL